ncbi:hypothetical protein [Endozoicomonas numazuensis]|uniref:hypothetical protein n=1 Tax=Endozoicomonas numazuensis TaxID=1137799 RepID=UPI000A9E6B83|nr:hypothetical protein [Endozoicomonas numazuensis]
MADQMKMAENLKMGYSFQPLDDEGELEEAVSRTVKFSLEGSSNAINEASYN